MLPTAPSATSGAGHDGQFGAIFYTEQPVSTPIYTEFTLGPIAEIRVIMRIAAPLLLFSTLSTEIENQVGDVWDVYRDTFPVYI